MRFAVRSSQDPTQASAFVASCDIAPNKQAKTGDYGRPKVGTALGRDLEHPRLASLPPAPTTAGPPRERVRLGLGCPCSFVFAAGGPRFDPSGLSPRPALPAGPPAATHAAQPTGSPSLTLVGLTRAEIRVRSTGSGRHARDVASAPLDSAPLARKPAGRSRLLPRLDSSRRCHPPRSRGRAHRAERSARGLWRGRAATGLRVAPVPPGPRSPPGARLGRGRFRA